MLPLPNSNPLTKQQLDEMKKYIDEAPNIQKQLNAAKAAGLDVTQQEKEFKEQLDRLQRIYAVYSKIETK